MSSSNLSSESITFNGQVVYRPFLKQEEFHASPALYRLFGGAAGPGKSYALLWEAVITCLNVPGCSCLLLRRTFPELERTLIKEFLTLPKGLYKSYNASKHVVTFSNGSLLYFGHLGTDSDVTQYQGAEFLFIGFDELTHFTYDQWEYLKSRNRCKIPGTIPRMAGASNPGGEGHAWVKNLWIDKKPAPGMDASTYRKQDHAFIRATYKDGPYANDAAYLQGLNSLSPELRKALADGSWDVFAGQYFDIFNRDKHTISRDRVRRLIKPWWPKWTSVDWGHVHHSAVLWHAIGEVPQEDGTFKTVIVTYREYVRDKMGPRELAQAVLSNTNLDKKDTERFEKITQVYVDPSMGAHRGDVYTLEEQFGDVLVSGKLPRPVHADNDRVGGWRLMYDKLKAGEWLISEDCTHLIEALPMLNRNAKKPEDILKVDNIHDDVGDCARYGLKSWIKAGVKPFGEVLAEKLENIPDNTMKHLAHLRLQDEWKKKTNVITRRTRFQRRGPR